MSIDTDKSVNKTISMIHENIQVSLNFFYNGGDQNNQNILESLICSKLGIN